MEAETNPSCSVKRGRKKRNVVLAMQSLRTFLEGGIFQGGRERDSSCRPTTNYKNINKTLCAQSFFLLLNLFSLKEHQQRNSIFFPPRSQVGNTKWPHIYVYRYIFPLSFPLCLVCVYIYIYIVSLTQ